VDAITVTVTDNGTPLLSDVETFNLTVNGVNRAPVLAAIGNRSVNEGGSLSISLSATDADGDALAFSATGLPPFCSLTDNGNGTGSISCNPGFGNAGVDAITVTVTDNGTPPLDAERAFTLNVSAPGQASGGSGNSSRSGGGGSLDWLALLALGSFLFRRGSVGRADRAGEPRRKF
jgi:hypothetical protein